MGTQTTGTTVVTSDPENMCKFVATKADHTYLEVTDANVEIRTGTNKRAVVMSERNDAEIQEIS
jgi:protein involved in sex pheromone biosynthesis